MIEIDEDLFKDIVATPWISSEVALIEFLERKGKAMSFLKIKSKPRQVPKARKEVKRVRKWSEFANESGAKMDEAPEKPAPTPIKKKQKTGTTSEADVEMTPFKGKGEKSSLL